jgi:hypothetical protein
MILLKISREKRERRREEERSAGRGAGARDGGVLKLEGVSAYRAITSNYGNDDRFGIIGY